MLDFARSKEQLFEKYNTSYEGLSSQEARRRLNDFGTNEIASAQKKNYLRGDKTRDRCKKR